MAMFLVLKSDVLCLNTLIFIGYERSLIEKIIHFLFLRKRQRIHIGFDM